MAVDRATASCCYVFLFFEHRKTLLCKLVSDRMGNLVEQNVRKQTDAWKHKMNHDFDQRPQEYARKP